MIRYLLLIGILIRLAFYFLLFSEKSWNIHMAFRFDERALSILRGEEVGNLTGWGSYPLFLSGIYKILDLLHALDHRIAIVFWLNQVLGLATVLIVLKILELLKVSEKISLWTVALLILLNPLQIYINGMNISESLFQISSVTALALYLGCFKLRSWGRWSLFFTCLAFSVLARNIIIPFIALLPFYIFFFDKENRRHLFSKPLVAGAVIGTLLIWGAGTLNARFDKNQNRSLNSNRGANIAQTWCEAMTIDFKTPTNTFWYSPPAFWPLEKTRSLYLDKDFNETAYYSGLAWDCLKKKPELIVWRAQSVLNVFTGFLYPDPLNNKLETAQKIYGGLYLACFLFVVCGFSMLWKNPKARFLIFFVVTNLAAVYLANTGEARFLYSFLPALTILVAMTINGASPKRYLLAFLSVSLAVGASFISPLHVQMIERDEARFMALNVEQKKEAVKERLAHLPTFASKALCDEVLSEAQKCLKSQDSSCDQAAQEKIFLEIKNLLRKPLTEENLFCRNLLMVRLRDEKSVQIPVFLIQKPSELPGGLEAEHPLVAIAGQLLHVDLLEKSGHAEMIPPGESYDQLLFTLLKYQHRFDYNRPEYSGAVTDNLKAGKPSPEAAQIFETVLKVLFNQR